MPTHKRIKSHILLLCSCHSHVHVQFTTQSWLLPDFNLVLLVVEKHSSFRQSDENSKCSPVLPIVVPVYRHGQEKKNVKVLKSNEELSQNDTNVSTNTPAWWIKPKKRDRLPCNVHLLIKNKDCSGFVARTFKTNTMIKRAISA